MIRFIIKYYKRGYDSDALKECIGMRLMGEEGVLNFHPALAFYDNDDEKMSTQGAIDIYEKLNDDDPDFDINEGYMGYTIDFLDEMKIRKVTEDDMKKL